LNNKVYLSPELVRLTHFTVLC